MTLQSIYNRCNKRMVKSTDELIVYCFIHLFIPHPPSTRNQFRWLIVVLFRSLCSIVCHDRETGCQPRSFTCGHRLLANFVPSKIRWRRNRYNVPSIFWWGTAECHHNNTITINDGGAAGQVIATRRWLFHTTYVGTWLCHPKPTTSATE